MDAQVQAGQSRQMGYQVAPGYELSLVERIFCELVEIDSPSFHEHEMAAEVRRRLEGLGFNVVEDATSGKNDGMVTSITSTRRFGRLMDNASDLVRLVHTGSDCGNLFATLPGVGEPVLFITHMDTVQPAFSKHAKVHANGMITSLGDTVLGADDLAGIACVMAAVDHLQQAGIPHRPVELACMVAEEVGNVGARAFDFSQSKAPVAFTLDYSADPNEYAYQAPTILYLTIEVIGRSAHAGFYPERGVNAIKIAAHAIDQVQCGRIGDDTTCNMGIISGGRGTNIVPSDVVIRGEVRSYDHAKAVHHGSDHGGRGGLAVRARHGDGLGRAGEVGEHLGARPDGNAQLTGADDLGVGLGDGRGGDHDLGHGGVDGGRLVADAHRDAGRLQLTDVVGVLEVAAGDLAAALVQDEGDAAHAGASDANEVGALDGLLNAGVSHVSASLGRAVMDAQALR